jgi:type IV pilus assembly protein PilB
VDSSIWPKGRFSSLLGELGELGEMGESMAAFRRQRGESGSHAATPTAPPGGVSSGSGATGGGGATATATIQAPRPAPGAPARLGDVVRERFGVTSEALDKALAIQAETGEALGALLVQFGTITSDQLLQALAVQFGLELVDLRHILPSSSAIAAVSAEVAHKFHALPISLEDGVLTLATSDPVSGLAANIQSATGYQVKLIVAHRREIEQGLGAQYRALSALGAQVASFEADLRVLPQVVDVFDANEGDAPIVQAVDLLLTQAARDRASDIHLEMGDDVLRVRYRVDGALADVATLPSRMAGPIASRIKIMAGMNIVERRRPQDGQFATTVDGHDLDVRVASCGTVLGEKVILRLLDKSKPALHLSDLGMSPEAFARFHYAIESPHGMVVCAGPTGSGKTTSLYAALRDIDGSSRSIVTIEDPVEYVFPSITQIQVNESAGITFANGLRSILRQDPDVILVGEVRDEDTARIAVQSSLTGHLVLSSLHGTDAISALFRFFDMGIESYLIASSVIAIIGQRLVRRVCEDCKTSYQPTADERVFWNHLGGDPANEFVTGLGCNFCHGTGYLERIGMYEILEITPEIAEVISVQRPSKPQIQALASQQGMKTLRDEARRLVETQITTVQEAVRAIHLL